ncbi:MAG: lipocalin family protein [Bacteroidaceae bacterium]|nr:lipocalin family protein [Bacteroidaceae bacterium]
MKKYCLMTTLMVIFLSLGLFSCSNDDDDNNGAATTASLTGLWQMTNVKGSYIDEDTGKKVSFNVDVTENGMEAFEDLDVADFVRFEFLGGNVFKEYEYIDGEWVQYDETTYTLNGKKLTMGQGKNADNNEIVSLTQDRLVLKDLDEEDLELEVTMKRIK